MHERSAGHFSIDRPTRPPEAFRSTACPSICSRRAAKDEAHFSKLFEEICHANGSTLLATGGNCELL
jgi:hypothetical protein